MCVGLENFPALTAQSSVTQNYQDGPSPFPVSDHPTLASPFGETPFLVSISQPLFPAPAAWSAPHGGARGDSGFTEALGGPGLRRPVLRASGGITWCPRALGDRDQREEEGTGDAGREKERRGGREV